MEFDLALGTRLFINETEHFVASGKLERTSTVDRNKVREPIVQRNNIQDPWLFVRQLQ
jgi:hypothetical protein